METLGEKIARKAAERRALEHQKELEQQQAYEEYRQRLEASDMQIEKLIGLTLKEIKVSDDEITFITECGRTFLMYHEQECCEDVSIDDICGNLDALIGAPIMVAEESTNSDNSKSPYYEESHTWTFYRIGNILEFVVIRWYGESNGYYSESVNFREITKKE